MCRNSRPRCVKIPFDSNSHDNQSRDRDFAIWWQWSFHVRVCVSVRMYVALRYPSSRFLTTSFDCVATGVRCTRVNYFLTLLVSLQRTSVKKNCLNPDLIVLNTSYMLHRLSSSSLCINEISMDTRYRCMTQSVYLADVSCLGRQFADKQRAEYVCDLIVWYHRAGSTWS